MQLVHKWECWTFCGPNFSCWSVGSKSVKVQLSTNGQRSYDWLTANERMWPVRWADVRGEERVTSLRTSAWEASVFVEDNKFDSNLHIWWQSRYFCLHLRICSTASLLQSAVEELKRLLLQNGYPQGIITFNINDVLNKNKNKPKEPVATVPKKDVIILLPYIGLHSNLITKRLKSCVNR